MASCDLDRALAPGEALVVADDFEIMPSRDYAPAYEQDSLALQTSGQFGVGVPTPAKAFRQVTIAP
ncbi:hypothetical protein ACI2LF_22795 [Kribbella sp. NPDC020789]